MDRQIVQDRRISFKWFAEILRLLRQYFMVPPPIDVNVPTGGYSGGAQYLSYFNLGGSMHTNDFWYPEDSVFRTLAKRLEMHGLGRIFQNPERHPLRIAYDSYPTQTF